jgi:hypothetical protein
MNITYEVIGADGTWLGSAVKLDLAELLQAIYPGSTIETVETPLLMAE